MPMVYTGLKTAMNSFLGLDVDFLIINYFTVLSSTPTYN